MSVWDEIRRSTAARIGLSRSGASLATTPTLAFRLAHAQARDAVHAKLDTAALTAALPGEILIVSSQAPDRRSYLLRPDLGRALHAEGAEALSRRAAHYDLAIVAADGLSATAAQRHAAPLITTLLQHLPQWRLAPLIVATQARVALGDQVAQALGADAVLMLVGERPGLSATDSLGAYLTWAPRPGTTDAGRNCVSNIRSDGLTIADSARLIAYLLGRMRQMQLSGVALKDQSVSLAIETD